MTNGEAKQISTGSDFFGVRVTVSSAGTYKNNKTGEIKEARRGVSINIQGNWMPMTATAFLCLVGSYQRDGDFKVLVDEIAALERAENGL